MAVCVHPLSSDGPVEQTQASMQEVQRGIPIAFDQPITQAQVDAEYEACVVHPFGDATNAAVVGYTAKNDKTACAQLLRNAHSVCRMASETPQECDSIITAVHSNPDAPPNCTMRTNKLPLAHPHDRGEWWRWVRDTSYSCKAEGWTCNAPDLSSYKAPSCSRDEECTAPVEQGWCDKEKDVCVLGGSKGKNCTRHEDCDHLSPVEGLCKNGQCAQGKTGVSSVYHVPIPCLQDSGDSLYTYCGKVEMPQGGTAFTGVCSTYRHDGQQYKGCRAFRDLNEMKEIQRMERDWQSQNRPMHNFHDRPPPWERMHMCSAENHRIINGRNVCTSTTKQIPLHTNGESCAKVLPHPQ